MKTPTIIFLMILSCQAVFSQTPTPIIQLNGSINLSTSYYSASGIEKRYPNGLSSAIVSTNLKLADEESHAGAAGSAARDPAGGYVGRLVILP